MMSSAHDPSTDTRRELVRGLLRPTCYPHRVSTVEHLETHISDVFLTGQYAYKLKKPLDLGFLDFSTLEKRQHFCEEELRLNRRLAPDLYIAVVPVTGEPSHPKVGADGPPLDYALQMRQFDQAGLLDRVLARGELTTAHLDELADVVAQFHAKVPRVPMHSEYGTPAAVMAPALQNFDQLRPLLEDQAQRERLARVQQWTAAQHIGLQSRFEQRRREGLVRECHGDLHLANMVLIEGHVRIFDCIEFNPQLRWIDVMNEIAFVAMDLFQRGHAHYAFRFLDRYLQLTGDYGGVPLLRYYMIYRALVRAKVAAMRAHQPDVADPTRQSLLDRCHAHVNLADELSAAPQPVLMITHGLSGSGKTSLAQIILERMGGIRIRSDVERKRLYGFTADARTGSSLGAGLYNAASGEATYERLCELARSVVEGGFPALVDAAFLRREQRDRLRTLAHELGVPFAIVHAEASEAMLRQRIVRRAATQADASEATAEVLDYQLKTQEPLGADERPLTYIFNTEQSDERVHTQQAKAMVEQLLAGSRT